MFKAFVKRIVPGVKADDDEDLIDPQQVLRDKCRASEHAKPYIEKLEECTKRVNSRTHTTETCAEELYDLLHFVDHCVSKDLFSKLK